MLCSKHHCQNIFNQLPFQISTVSIGLASSSQARGTGYGHSRDSKRRHARRVFSNQQLPKSVTPHPPPRSAPATTTQELKPAAPFPTGIASVKTPLAANVIYP